MVNMALFALTNGLASTKLMVIGPQVVEAESRDWAGIIMSFYLMGGIGFGSVAASFGMSHLSFPSH
jgi:hypothetical protein